MNLFEEFRFSAAKSPAKRPAPSAAPPPLPPPPARRNSNAAAAAPAAAVNSPSQAQTLPPGGVPEKLGDAPLRLIIVGHNPSSHAWASGHFYSNPSNYMWRLLREVQIAPPALIRGAEDDGKMPAACGVGFTDIGTGTPGTDSAQFSSNYIQEHWVPSFYARLAAHVKRASDSIGCTCGACGAPAIVAFSGKRQFVELLKAAPSGGGGGGNGGNASSSNGGGGAAAGKPSPPAKKKRGAAAAAATTVELGPQARLPPGWPLPAATEVWVLTSTSGASALTKEARAAPYAALAARLREIPWPRRVRPACVAAAAAAAAGD